MGVIEINGLTATIALALIIIGPASGVWSGLLIKNLTAIVKEYKEETSILLKELQRKTAENAEAISAIEAVMEYRKTK